MMPSEHALIALLWSEKDDEGNPLDSGDYPISDSLKAKVTADWDSFREKAEALGFDAEEHRAMMLHPDCEGDAWNAVAHDFILTRNHHGAGFWDTGRWLEPWASKLTTLAHSFGELSCYIGDDGAIYGE
jgi:hypothetical protein